VQSRRRDGGEGFGRCLIRRNGLFYGLLWRRITLICNCQDAPTGERGEGGKAGEGVCGRGDGTFELLGLCLRGDGLIFLVLDGLLLPPVQLCRPSSSSVIDHTIISLNL